MLPGTYGERFCHGWIGDRLKVIVNYKFSLDHPPPAGVCIQEFAVKIQSVDKFAPVATKL